MGLSLEWKEMNGAQGAPVSSTITVLRHKSADECTNDSDHLIPIKTGITNHGFGKTFYLNSLECTGVLSNLKLYGGGIPSANPPKIAWTGVTLFISDQMSDTYDEAEGTVDEGGSELVTYHSEVTSKTDFLSTYTSGGTKKSIELTGGAGSKTGTGRFSKNIFMQLSVTDTATNGLLNECSIIGEYDYA